MRSLGQLLIGLLTAAGSTLVVLGAFSLALLEGSADQATIIVPSPTTVSQLTPLVEPISTAEAQPTLVPTSTEVPKCPPPPAQWIAYTVQVGDTLEVLAEKAGVTAEQVMSVNCLITPSLMPGFSIFLPVAEPTSTEPPLPTVAPVLCGPYPGWVPYIVQSGDTLLKLTRAFGVSLDQLQFANCMTGTMIWAGQRLYVPNVPTRTPEIIITTTPTVPTGTPSPTVIVSSPTPTVFSTPSATAVPATETATVVPPTATQETPTTEPVVIDTETPGVTQTP